MQSVLSLTDQIHSQALEISTRYRRAEAELIDVIQRAEEHRVYIKRGHSSLFNYVIRELGLSESVAYSVITIARKVREVPELKTQIQSGALTLTSARRIVPLLKRGNQGANAEWLKKACELSSRQLEKEIVKIHPQEATVERASYVNVDRIKLELGLSEREMLRLRRVQDILSQTKKRHVKLEETLQILTAEYLNRHDPLEKANRNQVRKGSLPQKKRLAEQETPILVHTEHRPSTAVGKLFARPVAKKITAQSKTHTRKPIPSAIIHHVNRRDQRRCAEKLPDGSRCNQARWIEIHHKFPVHQGGSNDPENLITLCSAHHGFRHLPDGR